MTDVEVTTTPTRSELWMRLCLARSVLAHRPATPETTAVALQVLDGATIEDLVDPAVTARLDGRHLVVDCCPWCSGRHTHGAGDPNSSSYPVFGHRVSHCGGESGGGYYLVPPHAEAS